MLVPRSFLLLLTGSAILLAGTLLSQSELPQAEASAEVKLQSVYLVEPLGLTHQVRLEGVLGGVGLLTLDGNTCAPNEFGDRAACTETAFPQIPVTLRPLRVKDPAGAGRRLYRVERAVRPQGWEYTLVVPRKHGEAFRLVVDRGTEGRRVITLEPPPRPRSNEPAAEWSQGTYEALRVGTKVFLTARGEHPALGYEAFFEVLRKHKPGTPEFKFKHRKPEGPAAAVMTPFEVQYDFEAPLSVAEIVVHDKSGRHVVPILSAEK